MIKIFYLCYLCIQNVPILSQYLYIMYYFILLYQNAIMTVIFTVPDF